MNERKIKYYKGARRIAQRDFNFCYILGDPMPEKLYENELTEVLNVEIIKNGRDRFEVVTVRSQTKICPVKGNLSFITVEDAYHFIERNKPLLNLVKPYEEIKIESYALF